ncbi:MAG TPA: CHAT domain-containing protein [Steroidobacteraceae bacterium]|nr:CHAT domain-containing protein [Steroidobacteraceae bacterium]
MSFRRPLLLSMLAGAALLCGQGTPALELPPSCAGAAPAPGDQAPIPELRKRAEALIETDPNEALRLLCVTIPRAAKEYGDDSAEYAWWVGSLATPLIAYMDKNAEAIPLLQVAQPILEKRLGPYAPEVAEIHVAYAWIYLRQGRLADSGGEWEAALHVREHTPGAHKIELQKVLVGLAQVRSAQRDFVGTRQALDRAHAILVENGETVSEAAAAIENVYTNTAMREENYVEARRHAEAQLAIELQLKTAAPQLVPAYALLGQILERLDEYEASEQALREAVRLAEGEEGPLQRHHLPALTQLSSMLNQRGKPAEALDFAERGLRFGETSLGPDAPRLVPVLQILAEVHRSLGELPDALHLYERASGIVDRHTADIERQWLVAYYRGFGSLESSLGDAQQAEKLLTMALNVAGEEPTLSIERARALLALAHVTSHTDTAVGRGELLKALELMQSRLPDSHPAILRVINELCGIELEVTPAVTPHCDEAAGRLERAREVEPALRSAVYDNQSDLAAARADSERAYTLAIRSLAAAESLGTPEPLWSAHFRLARLLHARHEPALAIFFGKQSIVQIEQLRGYFIGEDRRLEPGFLQDKATVYRTVADWLMEEGRLDEGLEVLRLLKTEELYDFALRDAGWKASESSVELTGAEQRLLERYDSATQADKARGEEIDRLSRLSEAGRISPKEKERLDTLLAGEGNNEASRVQRIHALLSESGPAPATATAAGLVQAERAQRDLQLFGSKTAIAYYLLTENRLRVLIATARGQTRTEVDIDAAALKRDIGHFLDALSQREDVSGVALRLYDVLVRSVDAQARQAGANRLVLWLDGPLRYVPFSALSDGHRYLLDKYALQVYAEPRHDHTTRETVPTLDVRGLGVTQAVAGYRALPAVAEELCSVVRGPITGLVTPAPGCPSPQTGQGALNGEGFADAAFTEARLRTLLDEPRHFSVLHLGTHFSLRPGNAVRSFLLLGDGERLTLDTIGALDFGGVELLTLSACETGLGGAVTDDGREIEGLSAIAQRRGARRVVASLWQVEDVSTARLMRTMYASLASNHNDGAAALRQAQLALRALQQKGKQPYAHPYYWAGFVISGSTP